MPTREQFSDDNSFLQALRDFFAGQALAGMYSDGESLTRTSRQIGRAVTPDDVAAFAYAAADAMLEQREKSP